MHKGHCLCGAVRFTVTAPPEGASACHCGQCRRQSGHVWASAHVANDSLHIEGPVKWFASSEHGRRGFCPDCGSFLFWRDVTEDNSSFALGALDKPTGLRLTKHIYVADKGDYYDINDGLPQLAQH